MSAAKVRPLVPSTRPRVLLVFKRSLYELYVEEHEDPTITRLIAEGDSSVASIRAAHDRHKAGLETAIAAFRDAPIDLELVYRGDLAIEERPDLMVVVGGDGTLLDASHHVDNVPVLGLNSDAISSVGKLCTATADGAAKLVESYLAGELVQQPLTRLEVLRNGKRCGPLALNDVLVSHTSPASPTKYFIHHRDRTNDRRESHVSSGIWISTATGSTAAIRSAGGQPMPLQDQRLQWRVREPYRKPGIDMTLDQGFIEPDGSLDLVVRVRTGGIFFDGPHINADITYGDRLSIRASQQPLWRVVRPVPSDDVDRKRGS